MRTTHPNGERSFGERRDAGIAFDAASPEAVLARIDALAKLLDSVVRIPGTDIRVGVDALLGLVPVAGDLVSKLISSYIIYEARRLGASRWLIARMAANTTLDAIVGSVPILGDAFDVMYRANLKNMALLKRHLEKTGVRAHTVANGTIIDGEAKRLS